MKKAICLALMLMLTAAFSTGCYTTGKVAGDTVKGVQDGAKDLQKGYEDGKKSN